jgi:hypothetical protein
MGRNASRKNNVKKGPSEYVHVDYSSIRLTGILSLSLSRTPSKLSSSRKHIESKDKVDEEGVGLLSPIDDDVVRMKR